MAYPQILYKGQYTLKRVLTVPAKASTLTIADIGKLVTLDAAGDAILATASAPFFGVLRTINTNDDVATVDFSGVHEFTAGGTIVPGNAVIPGTDAEHVVVDAVGELAIATTRCVALTAAAATEKVQVFFLN